MQLVIIAGGKGTRLGLNIPKPMCPIAGIPILQHQIELAQQYGINEIFILSGHMSQMIVDYFGNGFGVKIHHIVETQPMGTAGCLKLLEEKLRERFMVFYGDVMMNMDLHAFMQFDKQYDSVGTVVTHPNDHPFDSDLLKIDDDNTVIDILPTPRAESLIYTNAVNAAIYILSPDLIKYIEVPSDFGKNVFPKVIAAGEVLKAYHSAEYIKDMGTKDRLEKVSADFKSGKIYRFNRKNKRAAIFLDRDGVLIEDMDTHPSLKDFKLLPRVSEALKMINESNYLAIVVTNQPMIAKGFVTFDDVKNINMKLETVLGNAGTYVDDIFFCPHHPDKGFPGEVPHLKTACNCRKPKIGMIDKAKEKFNIDCEVSWMIGDRRSDVQAGAAAGCRSILIGKKNDCSADYCFPDLYEAIKFIVNE